MMTKHRLFLDANVLYSAAYTENSRLRKFWDLTEVILLSSDYAVMEARRNLAADKPDRLPELNSLIGSLEIVSSLTLKQLSGKSSVLSPKDIPILMGAMAGGATHLITGDKKHFGKCFGKRLEGILVLRPAAYLEAIS
jgi:predicted nucleic acid-binding protein